MKDLVNISKNSWLGNIPSNWELLRVKNIFGISKEKNDGEELPVLSLTQKGIKIRDISDNEGQMAATYENYTRIRKDDIVFNPMDLCTGAVDLSIFDGVISLAYTTIREKKKNKSFLKYYKYFFQWHYLHEIFFPFGQGVSVDHRWTLKDDILMNFPILVPPLEIQKNIADFLDEKTKIIDELVVNKVKMIELLREKRAALITHAVTKGLDPKVRLVNSLFGDIPTGWQVLKFRNVSKMIKTGGTPSTENGSYFDGDLNWFTPGDFDSDNLQNSNRKINKEAIRDGECKLFPSNCVLMISIGATLGKVAYSEKDFSCNQQINVIQPNSKAYYKYMYYFISMHTDLIKSNSLITTIGILNQNRLKNIEILVPPINDQIDISSYLDIKTRQIDNGIFSIKTQINQLKEYRSSLIYSTVTGRVKV